MKRTKTFWRRALLVAAAIIVVAMWRYEDLSEAASDSTVNASASATPVPPRSSNGAVAAAAPPAAEPGSAERSLDLPALRKALAGRQDAEAQMQRVVAFARFRDLVSAYGNGKHRMSAAEKMRLARQILSELPEHVARNEVLPVQAEAMTAALLTDAEPDPLARSAELAASYRQWDAYSKQTVGPSPAQDARYLAYSEQSRAIFQEVQATVSDPEQQQAVIAKRLQTLRVQLFDRASSPDAH